jgi:hypothetical protein
MTYDVAVHPMPCPKEEIGEHLILTPIRGRQGVAPQFLILIKLTHYPDFVRLPLVRKTPRRVEAESTGGAASS